MTDEKFLNSSGMICYDLWAQTRTQSTFEIVYYFFFLCVCVCVSFWLHQTSRKGNDPQRLFRCERRLWNETRHTNRTNKNRTRLKIKKKQHPNNKREERTNR